MSCQQLFRVSQEMQQTARKAVNAMTEFGGDVKVDFAKGVLHEGNTVTDDKYAGIQFTRSLVEWHSHPAKCTETECAISLPSPRDVVNVLSGAVYGVQAHIVYSKEGAYVIQVSKELREKTTAQLPCSLRVEACRVAAALNSLHEEFMTKKIPYTVYQRRWMTTTQKLGFLTSLTPNGTRPEVVIDFDCVLRERPAHIIPVQIKNAPERKFKDATKEAECPLCDSLKQL